MKRSDPVFYAVQSFFTDYLQRTRGCSQRTLESYRDTLRLFFDYTAGALGITVDRLRLTDFDSDLLLAFLEHLEGVRHNRISTRNCRLAALHSFFAHALRLHPEHSGQLARILALPSKRHLPAPPRYLDPPVIQTLLRHPDRQTSSGRRDFALLLFLYNTGARVSEAASLRGKDLLPGPAVSLHGKGGKDRVSPLWPETLAAIQGQQPDQEIGPEQSLFRNARGHSLSRHGINHILGQHAASLHQSDPSFPAKVWPHLLRHSCAVALLQAGVDLATIRDQLGHVSVATTGRYATSNLKLKRNALEAFWAVSGIAPCGSRRWRPGAQLSQFLHSI
jgi:site-specific recombinase XerD